MRRPALTLGLAVLGLVAALPSRAAADPSITATCSSGSGESSCTQWFTSNTRLTWSWSPQDGTVTDGCAEEVFTADGRSRRSCAVSWGGGGGDQLGDEGGGQSASVSITVKVDKTPPNVTSATAARKPDLNDWFTQPIGFTFAASDATSGVASCDPVTYSSPDSAGASVIGTCRDNAGNIGRAPFKLSYDGTPPAVAAIPERPPDANGWYNHPVAFSFQGTDAGSGVRACTSARTYKGPDSGAAGVKGRCTDNVGHAATLAVPLSYDATPPTLRLSRVVSQSASATLAWSGSPDTSRVVVTRSPGLTGAEASPVYDGPGSDFTDATARNGVEYRYTVRAFDPADNSGAQSIAVIPGRGTVLRPGEAAWVTAPPLLRWPVARRAAYYNVQLFRLGGSSRGRVVAAARARKVMSTWPHGPGLTLQRGWRYAGKRQRLALGRYRWYVWPGYGPQPAHRYGRLLGSGTFRVVR